MYYSDQEKDWLINFRAKLFNELFMKYSPKWDRKNARLLDFSGGPVILNYISAAPHVNEIVHSAYKEDERKEIELWKNDNKDAHDWSPYVKYVVNEIEGLKGDAAWQERVALLRSKIKVASCNVYDEHPITPAEDSFSIICTSLALESACKTFDDFKAGVKKLVQLLRLGGYISILFVEEETFYSTKEGKWAVLQLSLPQVQEAVEEASCVVLMTERDPMPIESLENPILFDQKAFIFLAAYKVK
ncbi:Phenylethanolamine N-methyltransferase [Geodia barretti]|uniref:Phenylethanolamine N-methyltransferase n=1 Tax=Geodia barretti TaxID=519541 RepID=A0AA35RWY9_GEOBA|nr:Phenylethanolamine N-methyltransferase [Geodia barretti]